MSSLLLPRYLDHPAPLFYLHSGRFKTEYLSLSAIRPIDREEVAMTSLLLSVLRRGTKCYPSLQSINRRLDALYGVELSIRNFYRGNYQVVGFSLDFLGARHLPDRHVPLTEALEVVCQILFHPLLDEQGLLTASFVEDEKRYQQDVIRSMKNNPAGYAMDRCQSLFYGDEPCGAPIYGSVEEVEAITPERLTAHWKKLVAEFVPTCFFIGSTDEEELRDALGKTVWKHLGHLQKKKIADSFTPVEAIERASLTEDFPSCQSHLCVGLSTGILLGDRDYYAAQVYNELLLGASPVSRLFLGLREKQSLCYSCSSSYRSYTGAIFIRCGLSKSCCERAEEEIRRQLSELKKGHFSASELRAAQQSLVNAFAAIEDSPEAMEGYFFGRSLFGLSTSLEESRAGFLSVTKEDLVRVAKKVLWKTEFFLSETLGEEAIDENQDD